MQAPTQSAPDSMDQERLPTRVLLAEDDTEMRRLIVSALRKDGCEVVVASDGPQLIEMLVTQVIAPVDVRPADVVISDVRMPGLSGLDALEALRKQDTRTPVILITAFGDAETHAEAHRLGAIAVFNKPFDMDDLRCVVTWFSGPH